MGFDPFSLLDSATREAVLAAHEEVWEGLPEFAQKWGARGKRFAEMDMAFHASFLDTALDIDPEAFTDYAQWAARVLAGRGIEAPILAQALRTLAKHLGRGEALLHAAADAVLETTSSSIQIDDPFIQALLQGDLIRTMMELRGEDDLPGHQQNADRLMSAMRTIGEAWADNQVTVGDEHVATATCQMALAILRQRLPSPVGEQKVLLACVEGNQHDLGLRATADQCLGMGWQVCYMGADVPTDSLVARADNEKPDVVFLSAAIGVQIHAARDAVARLHHVGVNNVIVGGNAFLDGGRRGASPAPTATAPAPWRYCDEPIPCRHRTARPRTARHLRRLSRQRRRRPPIDALLAPARRHQPTHLRCRRLPTWGTWPNGPAHLTVRDSDGHGHSLAGVLQRDDRGAVLIATPDVASTRRIKHLTSLTESMDELNRRLTQDKRDLERQLQAMRDACQEWSETIDDATDALQAPNTDAQRTADIERLKRVAQSMGAPKNKTPQ